MDNHIDVCRGQRPPENHHQPLISYEDYEEE